MRLILLLLLCSSAAFPLESWTTLERTTTVPLYRLCFLDSLTGWVVGDSGTILKTTNGGARWTHQNSHVSQSIGEVFFLDKNNGWALALVLPDTTPAYGTIVLRTTDGGDTWTNAWYPDELFRTIAFLDTLHGWMAGERGRIVGTTDAGTTWFQAAVDSSNVGFWGIRRLRFHDNHFGFGVGGRMELLGVVWRTTNGGGQWTPSSQGADPILDVHFFDSLHVLGISGGFDDGTSMVRTMDGGGRWDYTYIGILGEPRALSFRTASEGWVPLGFAGTVMYTLDSGKTWIETPTPANTAMYDLVFTDSLTGYMVGSDGTILKYQGTSVHVAEQQISSPLPGSLLLHPNYPNPFNPSTVISFDLPIDGTVTLTVYDVLGKEVYAVTSEQKRPGTHRMKFDADDLASGIYLYRIRLSSNTSMPPVEPATGKIVLIR